MDISQAISHAKYLHIVSDSPVRDIQLILSHILDMNLAQIIAYPEYELNVLQQQNFHRLLKLRQTAMPIAYILNKITFWSLELYVDSNCLIPRPETEILVAQVISRHNTAGNKLLDLGTGSGAISIAVATEYKDWNIIAVDNSTAALAIAKRNALNYNLENISFVHSNWFAQVSGKFDIIVANPPYIAEQDKHLADLQYEPQSALVAANHGLEDLAHIIKHSSGYLSQGGSLYLEHGFNQAGEVSSMLKQSNFTDIKTIYDLDENPRVSYGKIMH